MKQKLVQATILGLLLAALIPAVTALAETAQTIQSVAIANQHSPRANIISAGQPSQAQFAELKAAGIQHVINLRPAGEQNWDEAQLVSSLGMHYHSIPVAGPGGVTWDNAAALQALLTKFEGEPTLVHCASGNRVGALMALSAAAQGETPDNAIAEGKRWGLTSLENLVRKELSKPTQLCCAKDKESKRGG